MIQVERGLKTVILEDGEKVAFETDEKMDAFLKEQKTKKAGHTPGPWISVYRATQDGKGGTSQFSVETGGILGGKTIATVGCWGTPEAEANTKLIAASPKLLEACKDVLNKLLNMYTLSGTQNNGRRLSAISTLARAIDEADGSISEQNKADENRFGW
jgi:hypothetical protein